jgi:hypothetical protein
MWKPFQFAKAVSEKWGTVVTSGAIIGLLGIWQGLGHTLPPAVYWVVGLCGLVVAAYRAWLTENAKYLQEKGKNDDKTTKAKLSQISGDLLRDGAALALRPITQEEDFWPWSAEVEAWVRKTTAFLDENGMAADSALFVTATSFELSRRTWALGMSFDYLSNRVEEVKGDLRRYHDVLVQIIERISTNSN